MKHFIISFLMLASISLAHADGMAKIRVNISGSAGKYFLCLPGVGCLKAGKTFPITHSFEMDSMYLLDASQGYKVYYQGLPASCNRTVDTNQTITISGSVSGQRINGLHCSVS